jgi:hypothetical protein
MMGRRVMMDREKYRSIRKTLSGKTKIVNREAVSF